MRLAILNDIQAAHSNRATLSFVPPGEMLVINRFRVQIGGRKAGQTADVRMQPGN